MRCPICSGESARSLFTVAAGGARRTIDECRSCGTAYLHPLLTTQEQRSLYGQEYFENFYGEQNREKLEGAGLGLLNRLRPLLPGKGRVLDIGAAWGCYLEPFRSEGWSVQGVEASEYARAAALRTYGLRLCGDISAPELEEGSFDLLIMSQFLEHVPDPVSYIGRAYALLKPGGILFISVPNFGSQRARRMKQDWPSLRPGEHMFFFSRRSLRFLAERSGFAVLSVDTPHGVMSREECALVVGGERADRISRLLNRFMPWLKPAVRGIVGNCLQGEGLELTARKKGIT